MKRKNSEVHWVTPDRNVTATYDKTGVPSYPQGKKAPPAHQIARDEFQQPTLKAAPEND
jgi:hypothetical protein